MSDGDAQPSSSREELLRPANFPAYVGAALRVYKLAGRSVALAFIVMGVLLALVTATGVTVASSADSDRILLVVLYLQLLALPFFASILAARTSRVMARAVAGEEISVRRAGAELQGLRSHLIAGAMIAALLTLLFLQLLGLLGALVASHLLVGPPIFAQVIALERKPLQDAWARTKELWKGNVLRLFLYLLCAALGLVMFEVIVSGIIFTVLATATGEAAAVIVNTPVSGAVSGLGVSFMSALGLVAYFDLRSKDEESFSTADLVGGDDPEV